MKIKWTTKRLVISMTTIVFAVCIPLTNIIVRSVDPSIPINKTANTIGLLLFIVWIAMPLALGWYKERGE